jgi:hypothetical protein
MSECRSCGALVRWAVMPGGKRMPLDADPSPEGTIALHSDGVQAAVLSRKDLTFLNAEERERLYVSHFATCPNAARHRRRGASRGV